MCHEGQHRQAVHTAVQAFEKRLWPHQHALRQFENALNPELLMKLEDRGLDLDRLWDMSASEIGSLLRHPAAGKTIAACLEAFPALQLDAQLQPITRSICCLHLCISPSLLSSLKTSRTKPSHLHVPWVLWGKNLAHSLHACIALSEGRSFPVVASPSGSTQYEPVRYVWGCGSSSLLL